MPKYSVSARACRGFEERRRPAPSTAPSTLQIRWEASSKASYKHGNRRKTSLGEHGGAIEGQDEDRTEVGEKKEKYQNDRAALDAGIGGIARVLR